MSTRTAVVLVSLAISFSAVAQPRVTIDQFLGDFSAAYASHAKYNQPTAGKLGVQIEAAARVQVDVVTTYEPAYVKLKYPNGDPPAETGVCTDVVVRALRGVGVDLQAAVNQDMRGLLAVPASGAGQASPYPDLWGLTKPDANIDHRRVPNLMVYLHRHALPLTLDIAATAPSAWQPGDIVFWDLGAGRQHTGIVSATKSGGGVPHAIHHWPGQPVADEDVLTTWKLIGHYRWP